MGYSSPTSNDVDDGEDDAYGTQVGQGDEGDRPGASGCVPERAERDAGGQSPPRLRSSGRTCSHRPRSVVVVRSVPDGEDSSLRAAVHAKLG
jgi:hypothetical protein